jgi:hypothetical protein
MIRWLRTLRARLATPANSAAWAYELLTRIED